MGGFESAWKVLARHDLAPSDLHLSRHQGIANETWMTDQWVVRLSLDPEYREDLYTESVAVPAVIRAGVHTPEMLAIQLESVDDLPPYSIARRVNGQSLSTVEDLDDPSFFFYLYGKELRKVHTVLPPADPKGFLDEAWEIDESTLLARAERHRVDALVRFLLEGTHSQESVCFVHQDLHADNVLVDLNSAPIFIDWGDAGIGEPAVDFRFIPCDFLEYVFEGYGQVTHELQCRVLIHMWDQYFYRLEHRRNYGQFGDSSLASLVEATREILV